MSIAAPFSRNSTSTSAPAATRTPRLQAAALSAWISRVGTWVTGLSGIDTDLLASAPRAEKRRARALGTAVVIVAAMAAGSLTYSLHSALHVVPPLAVLVSLGWAVVVGNVERILVATVRRGAHTPTLIVFGLLRVVMAGLVGLIVALPLILRLFHPEIALEQTVQQTQARSAFTRQLAADPRYAQLPALQTAIPQLQRQVDTGVTVDPGTDPQVSALTAQVTQATAALSAATAARINEDAGAGPSRHAGQGPVYAQLQAVEQQRAAELTQARSELAAATAQARGRLQLSSTAVHATASTTLAQDKSTRDSLLAARDSDQTVFDLRNEASGGLASQIRALHRLAVTDSNVGLGYLAVTLVLIAVDITPLFAKLALLFGPPSHVEQQEQAQSEQQRQLLHNARELAQIRLDGEAAAARARAGQDKEEAEADQVLAARKRAVQDDTAVAGHEQQQQTWAEQQRQLSEGAREQTQIRLDGEAIAARARAGQIQDAAEADRLLAADKRKIEDAAAAAGHEQVVRAVQEAVTREQLARAAQDPTQFLAPDPTP